MHMKEHKAGKHGRHGKQTSKEVNKQTKRQTSKRTHKKVASTRDKCRFGSIVHDFIVLKHVRHTSKQDLSMDMQASM